MAKGKTFADSEILTAADINNYLVYEVPVAGDVYDTGWINTGIAWSAGYEDYQPSVTVNHFEMRRIGMEVRLRGLVKKITSSSSSVTDTMFTLPTGWRPSRNEIHRALTNASLVSGAASTGTAHTHAIYASSTSGLPVRCTINSAGTVQVVIPATMTLDVNQWVSVAGLSFWLG